jgi:hypothetical protein
MTKNKQQVVKQTPEFPRHCAGNGTEPVTKFYVVGTVVKAVDGPYLRPATYTGN